MFPQSGIDKLPKNLCFQCIDTVTHKNKNFHIVIHHLMFPAVIVGIAVIVADIAFPKQMFIENVAQMDIYLLHKAVE
jgi:uncharacterized UBP type Zn finger protein